MNLPKNPVVYNNQPTQMTMTIASIQEALEFWLKEKVLREAVKIEKVSFSDHSHFTITLTRGARL